MACPSALRVGLSLATPALPATPRLAAPRQSKARSSIRLPAASEWPRTGAGKRGNARVGGGGSCAPFKRGTQCQRACSRACSLGAHDAARTRTGTRVRRATRTSAPAAARTGLIPRPTTASHGARVCVACWVGTGHDVLAGSRSRGQADKAHKTPPRRAAPARSCDSCWDVFGTACTACNAAAGCISCEKGYILERGRCKRPGAISPACSVIDGAKSGDAGFKCSPNAKLGSISYFLDPGCTTGCTQSAGCRVPKNCAAGTKFVRPCGSTVGMCLDCKVRGRGVVRCAQRRVCWATLE